MRRFRLAIAAGLLLAMGSAPTVAASEPTCADFDALGIVVHGQHIVRDYVIGSEVSGWPVKGGAGQYVAGEGAALPGGAGARGHLPAGIAPGASFCNSQSRSPGFHVSD